MSHGQKMCLRTCSAMYTHLNMAASDSADNVPGKDFNGLSSKEIAEI